MKITRIMALAFAMAAVSSVAMAQRAATNDMAKIIAEAKAEAEKAVAAGKGKVSAADILMNRPEALRMTGGFLDVPAEGTSIILIDSREKGGGACGQFKEVFEDLSKMNVVLEKTPVKDGDCPLNAVKARLAATGAAYALAVVECDKGAATLAVFPDDRVAIVNAALLKGGDDPLAIEVRVVKELWRGLGFVSGIGYAPFPNDVFQPAYSISELDALAYQVMQPLHFQKMYKEMERFGVKRSRHIPYRLAVFEGWAASPTNEYQRIVWDEVKAWQATNALKKASAPAAK